MTYLDLSQSELHTSVMMDDSTEFTQALCNQYVKMCTKKKKKNSVKKLDRGESVYTPFTLILVALLAIYREQTDRSCSLI